MPTYEYECTQCERRFEEFQSIMAKPLKRINTECADCTNRAPVRRLMGTGSAVIFKGSGFYETDYRTDSYKKDAKADKKEDTKKDDTKTDTKKDKSTEKTPAPEKAKEKTGDAPKTD